MPSISYFSMAGGYLFEYLTEDGSNNGFEVFHSLPVSFKSELFRQTFFVIGSLQCENADGKCSLYADTQGQSSQRQTALSWRCENCLCAINLWLSLQDSLLLKQCLDTRPALISVKQVLLANSDHKVMQFHTLCIILSDFLCFIPCFQIVERAKKKVDAMKASEAASRKITPSRLSIVLLIF